MTTKEHGCTRPKNDLSGRYYFWSIAGVGLLVFGAIAIVYRQWSTVSLMAFVGLVLVGLVPLIRKDRLDLTLHVLTATLVVYQTVLLTSHGNEANLGVVWFLVVPVFAAAIGKPIHVAIWTPISMLAAYYSWTLVAEHPVMTHPMTLTNLLGTLVISALVSVGFVIERLRRERALREALHQAEQEVSRRRKAEMLARQAEETTSRFLSSMSHELRTPMTSLGLSAEQLLHDERDHSFSEIKNKQALVRIHDSAQATLTLLNDVLDLAKIDANKILLKQENATLDTVLDDIRILMLPHAEASGIALFVGAAPQVALDWYFDASRVRQVLLNLVGNAIKHTATGEVCLVAKSSSGELEFLIRDTGIGIGLVDQARIFDPFVQLAEAAENGTGLGLSIAKSYACALGGDIELVSSVVGQGSVFRFYLNIYPQSERTLADRFLAPELKLERWSVNTGVPELYDWATAWLKIWGCSVDDAGAQLCLLESDSARSGHPGELLEVVAAPSRELPVAAPSWVGSAKRGCGLICDDNKMIREVLVGMLESMGYKAIAAPTIDQAVIAIEQGGVSFVFMDVQLLNESGIEALRRIRELPGSRAVTPVCMLSGSDVGRVESLTAGADDYLLKPPRAQDLSRAAAALMELANTRGCILEMSR
ncbi:MAG: hybrid sensor histidine kinase/response regulator [Halioglobus sp.]